MKTISKTIRIPQLKIAYDDNAVSPRQDCGNLGYFITQQNNYNSPDYHEELQAIIKETSNEAQNQVDHIKLIKKMWSENNKENPIIEIFSVYCYEHGGIAYKLGTAHGFDYSNCGFYIVTKKTLEENGNEKVNIETIEAELKVYNQYANGELYAFQLLDENGEDADACGGFYDIEDIKDHLPDEWQDEDLNAYFINN